MAKFARLTDSLSVSELHDMYMEEGVTYDELASRLDVSVATLHRYITPVLTTEEKARKKREGGMRINHLSRKKNVLPEKKETVMNDIPEVVTSMRDRMIAMDKERGIVRQPDFGGMTMEDERHSYVLRGVAASYRVDLVAKSVEVLHGSAENTMLEGFIGGEDLMNLANELRTIAALL